MRRYLSGEPSGAPAGGRQRQPSVRTVGPVSKLLNILLNGHTKDAGDQSNADLNRRTEIPGYSEIMELHRNAQTREQSPVLRVFGDLAERMAALLQARPEILPRIAFAPPRAVHAVATFLYVSPEASWDDLWVASHLANSHPRELLHEAYPGAPPRLYRALDRAGDRVHARGFYERLIAICRGPYEGRLLEAGPISEQRFAFFEALLDSDPFVAGISAALPEGIGWVEAADAMAAILRCHGSPPEVEPSLPAGSGIAAVVRRLQQALDDVRAPTIPFTPPPPLRMIETVGELRRLGKQYKNCIAQPRGFGTNFWFNLADGSVVYLVQDEPPVLVSLRRICPGLWHIDQMNGPKNHGPAQEVQDAIAASLRRAGVRLLPTHPSYALSRLYTGISRPADEEDDFDDYEFLDLPA